MYAVNGQGGGFGCKSLVVGSHVMNKLDKRNYLLTITNDQTRLHDQKPKHHFLATGTTVALTHPRRLKQFSNNQNINRYEKNAN
jgi:hypothetical protein